MNANAGTWSHVPAFVSDKLYDSLSGPAANAGRIIFLVFPTISDLFCPSDPVQ